MTRPLLSICIPTYNRAPLLKEAIESVLSQVDKTIVDIVEIVVSDNASTDETTVVVKQLSDGTNLPIKYFKNERNVGFDGNILLVVDRACGDFAWILGDDDLLCPGVLKDILLELQGQVQADLYFGEKEDFYLTPDQPMRFRRIMKLSQEKIFDFNNKQEIDNYFCHNKKLIAYFNYISNIIFNRDKWLRVKGKEGFIGSGYIHLYVFQTMMWGNEPGILKYLPATIVKRRWGNDGPGEPEMRLKMDVEMYRWIAAAVFSDKKYVRLIDDLVIRNDGFSWAVKLKIKDPKRYVFSILPFLFRVYGDHLLFWTKLVPLVFIPNSLLRFMRGFYRKKVKGEPLGRKELMVG